MLGSPCPLWHEGGEPLVEHPPPQSIFALGPIAFMIMIPKIEIEFAQDHLSDIETACKRAHKIWTAGNHDLRLETKLATVAPEFAKVKGVHLSDHFPLWKCCWSTWINNTTVVKHRLRGGIHASRNNTLNAGMTTVTGHLHKLQVVPLTDYRGDRYGVQTGCISETDNPAFVDYTEDGNLDWQSGFVVMTYTDGKLLMPELVKKWDDSHVEFRGKVIRV